MRRALAAAAILLVVPLGCRREAKQAESHRAENERLHQRLDEMLNKDPVVSRVMARPGDVQLRIRAELVTALVKTAARRYLDRVELDLSLEKPIHETGTIKTGTFLGKMKAGEWDLNVVIHRARGVLAAGEPQLSVEAGNRIRVKLPVTIQKAEGSATVNFKWDSKGLASVVCRDFEVSRDLRARLISDDYTLEGVVQLAVGAQSVRAEPAFPRTAFRLKVDLLPASWQAVKEALTEQDTLLRCGTGLNPDAVLPKLSALLAKGFDVHLPRSLFRAFDLPGSVGGTGSLDGHEVQVTVVTEALEVVPEALWYSASVRSRAVPSSPSAP